MTENDVAALEAEVLASPLDAERERAWARAVLADMSRQEQELMAAFKLWKFMRDEGRMQGAANELKKTRAAIGYLKGVLGQERG